MLPPDPCGVSMCEQCDEFQEKIDRYRKFLNQYFDPLTTKNIKRAIEELEQQKAALHPNSTRSGATRM